MEGRFQHGACQSGSEDTLTDVPPLGLSLGRVTTGSQVAQDTESKFPLQEFWKDGLEPEMSLALLRAPCLQGRGCRP